MTDVLRGRPRSPGQRPDPPAPAPSVVVHGALAALAAALSGLAVLAAVVLVAWVADARSGSSGASAVRAAADAWLLAHGGGLSLPGGRVAGVPLGLTLLAAVVLHRAGASLARAVEVTGLRAAGRATGALAVVYGLTAAAVARIAATPDAASGAVLAGLGATLLAGLAGGLGVVRGAALTDRLRAVLPARVPAIASAALAAVLGLVGAGLLLVLVSLGVHAGRVGELTGALDAGLVGTVVLVVGCLLLLPNAALWATAYAAGPGFAVGVGTGVSPFSVALGPVPAFPLLAALPQDGTPPPAVRAVLLLPVLAGVVAGVVLVRALPAEPAGGSVPRLVRTAGWGLAAGVTAAAALALLALLAGGRLGDGYLAAVGPSPWRVLVALAVEIGAPAALTAALLPPREPAPPAARPRSASRPADRVTDRPGDRAGDRGTDRARDLASDCSADRSADRGTDQAADRGGEGAAEPDQGRDPAGQRAGERRADPEGEAERGRERGAGGAADPERDPGADGTDRGRHPGPAAGDGSGGESGPADGPGG